MLHTFCYPSSHERKSEHLPDGDFKNDFEALRSRVMSVLQVKQMGGTPCNGDMLAEFLMQCVTKINEDGNITIPSVVDATMDAICARHAEECFADYKAKMAQLSQVLPELHSHFPHHHYILTCLFSFSYRTSLVMMNH